MAFVAARAIEQRRALHNQGELTALLAILADMDVHIVLEIGTWAGGSAWAFSRLPTINHIVSVDLNPQDGAAEQLAALPCRADLIRGDSNHAETYGRVLNALEGFRPDVVLIDGAHDYAHAKHDWEWYGSMVGDGGLIVLHDTQGYPDNPVVQVPKLWAEIRPQYRTTELIDVPGGPGGTGIVWF